MFLIDPLPQTSMWTYSKLIVGVVEEKVEEVTSFFPVVLKLLCGPDCDHSVLIFDLTFNVRNCIVKGPAEIIGLTCFPIQSHTRKP